MPLSDDSSELSPSLAELTAPTGKAATTITTNQSTPTAPAALAASDRTDRPVFPVTILGPTNSSNQAPPNRHDDDDVHTTRQQNNVTLRSSDANVSVDSRQQTRPASDAERDDDDGDTNARRRIDLPPCDSTGSRVPILPGTDSTGSYRVLLLYTTVRLLYRRGHLQRPLRS